MVEQRGSKENQFCFYHDMEMNNYLLVLLTTTETR